MFGFEHASERYSTTSSYGPGAMDDELRYMQHGDELSQKQRDQSHEQIIASSTAPQMMAVSACIACCQNCLFEFICDRGRGEVSLFLSLHLCLSVTFSVTR